MLLLDSSLRNNSKPLSLRLTSWHRSSVGSANICSGYWPEEEEEELTMSDPQRGTDHAPRAQPVPGARRCWL